MKDGTMQNSFGAFISLEGGEGAGKTQLSLRLTEHLKALGRKVVRSREPGGTAEGEKIRSILLSKDSQLTPLAELMLFNAARTQHVASLIKPAVQEGSIVLCDRYADSTVAYQQAGRGIPPETVLEIHRLAVEDYWPTLTLLLDIDPLVGLARAGKRDADTGNTDQTRFENEKLGFHQSVRNAFLRQASRYPNRIAIIDASQPAEIVFEQACTIVSRRLAQLKI